MPSTRFSRKRGRPRAPQVSPIDLGTPEFIRKQKAGLTGDILDVLHRQGQLNDTELQEALIFRRLYSIRNGNPDVQAMDLRHEDYSRTTNKERTSDEHLYREIAERLASLNLLGVLIRVTVFGEMRQEKNGISSFKRALAAQANIRRQSIRRTQ